MSSTSRLITLWHEGNLSWWHMLSISLLICSYKRNGNEGLQPLLLYPVELLRWNFDETLRRFEYRLMSRMSLFYHVYKLYINTLVNNYNAHFQTPITDLGEQFIDQSAISNLNLDHRCSKPSTDLGIIYIYSH